MNGRPLSLLTFGQMGLWMFVAQVLPCVLPPAQAAAQEIAFNRDIRPILSDKCFACHGPDKNQRKADLRLDTEAGLLGEGDKPGTVVAGKLDESELFRRITSADPDEKMPPPDALKHLDPAEIELLKRWIEQGAKWEGHWSFQPIRRPEPPAVEPPAGDAANFLRNPIDAFVLKRLRDVGLEPAKEADRRVLIRRLSLDLLGLPPSAEEVEAFVADQSEGAYEALVDRLLKSPHFGERMAMWWLDLVRYADSVGYHGDQPVSVSPFRDYVIRSFNENTPFDQFTLEQLAGDLLPNATLEQRVASGYNRLGMMSAEGGVQPKEYLAKYIAERVRNVGGAWLGLTTGCCECHDHKFDPLSMRDFYSLQAFFADIQEKGLYGGGTDWGPTVKLPTDEQAKQLAELDQQLADVRGKITDATPQDDPLRAQLKELEAKRAAVDAAIPTTLVTVAVPPRTIRVLARGNWMDDSGEERLPAFPATLAELTQPQPSTATPPEPAARLTRADLARWLMSPDNPLPARAAANRLWKLFFGAGLSRKLDDLGAQGEWPSHPELLDWLAAEFIASKWDLKHLIKLMVMSGTYRQSSDESPRAREIDPGNRWLSHQARFRLDAEDVRDNALAISGLLVRRIGGPSVKPYQPPGYWSYLNFPTREWQNGQGDELYRRGLYTHWQRQYLHPSLLAFDAPSREECVADRPRSNTPLQSLALLNDPSYVEAARAFAEQILRHGGDTPEAKLDWAFRRAVARPIEPRETAVLVALLEKHRNEFRQDAPSAAELLSVGSRPKPADLDSADLAAWTSVARAILLLHETITRN